PEDHGTLRGLLPEVLRDAREIEIRALDLEELAYLSFWRSLDQGVELMHSRSFSYRSLPQLLQQRSPSNTGLAGDVEQGRGVRLGGMEDLLDASHFLLATDELASQDLADAILD